MDKVQIIILAAGKGVRMQSADPKALTLLHGKPFLEHILDTVDNLDLPLPPIIVVGYKKERIIEVIGHDQNYAVQEEQLGTGHAVMCAKKFIDPSSKIILVISADQPLVSKETLLNIIETHLEKKPTITLATAILPDFKDWRAGIAQFGRIIRDENNVLKDVRENKDASVEEKKITEVNPALYAFDSDWLWSNIEKLKNENAQKEYYLPELVKLAFEQNKKIETVPLAHMLEVLQPNSKEELAVLETLLAPKS